MSIPTWNGRGGGGGGSISHWKPPLPKVIHLKKKTTAITEGAIISNRRQALALEVEVLRRISLHWVIKTALKRAVKSFSMVIKRGRKLVNPFSGSQDGHCLRHRFSQVLGARNSQELGDL